MFTYLEINGFNHFGANSEKMPKNSTLHISGLGGGGRYPSACCLREGVYFVIYLVLLSLTTVILSGVL